MSETEKKQITDNKNFQLKDLLLNGLRGILEIIVKYGLVAVAFGTGIYGCFLAFHFPIASELKLLVALVLVLSSMLGHLWMFARQHPRVQSDEVRDQLTRMTDLVERLTEQLLVRGLDQE